VEDRVKGQLCRTMTADGLELQGFMASPEGGKPIGGVIHVHGLAGNFYENRFVDSVAAAVAARDLCFLTINTRGRDYLSDFICEKPDGTKTYSQIGGIHEVFEDCLADIDAWVGFLRAGGTRRIVLQGHSHGALKVAYYLFRRPDPGIAGLILLSPSDDFGCQRARIGERFDEALQVARRMVGGGKGRDLMPEAYFHYPVSANTYLDIFDEGSKLRMFNLSRTDSREFKELGSIGLPVLALVGSVDEAFLDTPAAYLEQMRAEMKATPDFSGYVIEGAPHNYLDFEEDVAERIGAWLGSGIVDL
jgi:pimeloyl-ACP methyl ester carboxylesterase